MATFLSEVGLYNALGHQQKVLGYAELAAMMACIIQCLGPSAKSSWLRRACRYDGLHYTMPWAISKKFLATPSLPL